jgi:hypothetical protein
MSLWLLIQPQLPTSVSKVNKVLLLFLLSGHILGILSFVNPSSVEIPVPNSDITLFALLVAIICVLFFSSEMERSQAMSAHLHFRNKTSSVMISDCYMDVI